MEMDELITRSATSWKEYGERNNKYFYNLVKARNNQTTIKTLQDTDKKESVNKNEDLMRVGRNLYMNCTAVIQ
ncbi:hypothetical protein DM01DRAFT_1224072 [Hesseltinella vesiculosa]|uniref:Uncharacterized protein n=1 Tax=Hesseltinella vesiculosa TaxID=101127 RepID=A0A1X2G1Z9_9FUNG|nr:hypothetical protein DM01DRAFT_1224072 [Hesseltinella vesiculosa]